LLTLGACATPRPAVVAQVGLAAMERVALPARLRIPSLALDARVTAVGLDAAGAMDVPGTADEVAWYELGARPGERGNAVLAGHNVWNGRPGAFANLRRLRPGDRIEVITSTQSWFAYRVEKVTSYPADRAPLAEVFGPTDEPTLTLITCAGRADGRGDYPDRLVVRARAAD
jgi:LPXTG-site transpeptidase (sortase) family protein